jgi:hypothetical protein
VKQKGNKEWKYRRTDGNKSNEEREKDNREKYKWRKKE